MVTHGNRGNSWWHGNSLKLTTAHGKHGILHSWQLIAAHSKLIMASHGTFMAARGNSWQLMATHAQYINSWQQTHGNLNMATRENSWHHWQLMVAHAAHEILVATLGKLMATHGNLWQLMAIHGNSWHSISAHGNS
jgi:hypothetical protein